MKALAPVTHATTSLRALLTELKIGPPYVLVGHSYGGILIRASARDYPQEVAGLVGSELDQLPADLPPGMKAEIDNMRRLVADRFVELNGVRPPPTIPAAILVAAGKIDNPNDTMPRAIAEGKLRIAMRHELE